MSDRYASVLFFAMLGKTGDIRIVRMRQGPLDCPLLKVAARYRLGGKMHVPPYNLDFVMDCGPQFLYRICLGKFLFLYCMREGDEKERGMIPADAEIMDCTVLGEVVGIFHVEEDARDFASSLSESAPADSLRERSRGRTAQALLQVKDNPFVRLNQKPGMLLPAFADVA